MKEAGSAPLLAIDPGRDKCGIAVVDVNASLLYHRVVPTPDLAHELQALLVQFRPTRVLLGDGTSSRALRPLVQEAIHGRGALEVVSERHTTERAREEYWRRHPPKGLWRLVPRGLRVPPQPYDDYAAYVMACDFLARLKTDR